MNYGILGQHADDKVINNIRERIQKQQKLRSMQSVNSFKSGQLSSNSSKLLSNSENVINVKKTAHQALANKNRQVLSEISNTNSRPLRANSYRSLKNKKAPALKKTTPLRIYKTSKRFTRIHQTKQAPNHLMLTWTLRTVPIIL